LHPKKVREHILILLSVCLADYDPPESEYIQYPLSKSLIICRAIAWAIRGNLFHQGD
jgi:hypothetical protein